ncbi:LLM class flavin-dependent oxidoreductase [Streptomyces sp. FXJ1.4098]|nr:LLM class flavin-dependent oxidoreductase [Streptomyces sp. FXJ1.4098]
MTASRSCARCGPVRPCAVRGRAGGAAHPHLPAPPQDELPLWVTAAGSAETFSLAGELGCGILTHLLGQSWDRLEDNLADYSEALEAAGYGIESDRVTVMLHTFVAEDSRTALETARAP